MKNKIIAPLPFEGPATVIGDISGCDGENGLRHVPVGRVFQSDGAPTHTTVSMHVRNL
jgi:hypothetical protein